MPRGHGSPAVLPGPWALHSLLTLCASVGGGQSTHPFAAEHCTVQFNFNHGEPKRKGTNNDNFFCGRINIKYLQELILLRHTTLPP